MRACDEVPINYGGLRKPAVVPVNRKEPYVCVECGYRGAGAPGRKVCDRMVRQKQHRRRNRLRLKAREARRKT